MSLSWGSAPRPRDMEPREYYGLQKVEPPTKELPPIVAAFLLIATVAAVVGLMLGYVYLAGAHLFNVLKQQ